MSNEMQFDPVAELLSAMESAGLGIASAGIPESAYSDREEFRRIYSAIRESRDVVPYRISGRLSECLPMPGLFTKESVSVVCYLAGHGFPEDSIHVLPMAGERPVMVTLSAAAISSRIGPRMVPVSGLRSIVESDRNQRPETRQTTELVVSAWQGRESRLVASIWRRIHVTIPRRVFLVDSVGTVLPVYNRGTERFGRKPVLKNRAESWCPSLVAFPASAPEDYRSIPEPSDEYRRAIRANREVNSFGYRDAWQNVNGYWQDVCQSDYDEIRDRAVRYVSGKVKESGRAELWNSVDDIAQDAVIYFAEQLAKLADWDVASWDDNGQPNAWWPPVKPGTDMPLLVDKGMEEPPEVIRDDSEPDRFACTRGTFLRLSIRRAAQRPENGGRKAAPDNPENDGHWRKGSSAKPEYLSTSYLRSSSTNPMDAEVWRMTWNGGADYPMLAPLVEFGTDGSGRTKAGMIRAACQRMRFSTTAKGRGIYAADAAGEYDRLAADLHSAREDWQHVWDVHNYGE